MSPTPATHASPPDAIEKRALVSDATTPASMSPSRGPLVTTSEKTDDMRPRIASGVTVWLITDRQTALTLSAAPATASRAAAGHRLETSPAAATDCPQTITAPMTISPSRRTCSSHRVVSAATVAPAETAANSRPVPDAPAP